VGNGRTVVATPKRAEPPKGSRWWARKKADAVVRLLRGESLDELSRELRVEPTGCRRGATSSWPMASRDSRPAPLQPEDRKLKEAERKVGELTMELEVWRAAARKRGLQIPPRKRPR